MSEERSCWNCTGTMMPWCYLFASVKDALDKGLGFLNIDGDILPGKINDIFITLANTCTLYKERKEEVE